MRIGSIALWWRGCIVLLLGSVFSSLAVAAPSLSSPVVTPSTLTIGVSSVVTASCQVNIGASDPALLTNGVTLVRLTSDGVATSALGVMHDDGLNGDAVANDGIYTEQFTTTETAAGSFGLQCTAAFRGLLQRVKSPVATVNIVAAAGGGSVGAPNLSPNSLSYGIATSVTVTTAVSGGTPDDGSVMLQRLDSSGRVLAVLGAFHDDGLNGDVTAGDGIYTLVTSFTEFAVGTVPLRVSATFNSAASHVFSNISNLTVTGTPPPTVTITTPVNLAYLNLAPTTVNGTVSDPQATVVINSISAPLDANGNFSAQVPLTEGPNIVTATATSGSGTAGSASITVTLDTTPPHVTITSPGDQFTTSDAAISVAGNVNDIVVGTVNSQQAKVTVNGVASQVANRTFLAQNIPLALGSNTIQAVAVDRAGNSVSTQITVIRQAPQPGQIRIASGNNQTATIGTALSAPLVVALTDTSGNPAPNKPVIFKVTQDNGMLAPAGASGSSATPAASVLATTDANGQATVNWTLGMRAGAGSDAVQAYSVGYSSTAMFTASANSGTPGLIVVDTGNSQTGAVNQALPKPFIAVVIDAGHNRLPNVPVTFTVAQGGGSFAGQPTTTVITDSDGRAAATLTLGFQEGSSNNLVTADFTGDTGFPAAFKASGLGPGDPNATVISGVVLDNSNQPIAGTTVRALLDTTLYSSPNSAQTAASVQTDATGHFSIYKAPVGYVKLFVDGSTSTTPGPFPILEYDLVTVAGQVNTVNRPINLIALKTSNQLCVTDTTGGGTLTIPDAPGFSLTFAPGQVTFPGGSKTGCVSVTRVHPDKVPMEPAFGQQPRFIVTIQPAGAVFNPPAAITIPNVDGLQPRAVTEMYSFDHDISSFVAIGTGTVSGDGQVIRSSPGVGVLKAGWHCGGDPTTIGTVADCPLCNYCTGVSCAPNDSLVPPQASPTDCLKEVCRSGYVTNVPDDSEIPSQVGALPCQKFVCTGGITDSVPDDSQTLPQIPTDFCRAEVCLAGVPTSIEDDDKKPLPPDPGYCADPICHNGHPAAEFNQEDTPQADPGDCCEWKCKGILDPEAVQDEKKKAACEALGGRCAENTCACLFSAVIRSVSPSVVPPSITPVLQNSPGFFRFLSGLGSLALTQSANSTTQSTPITPFVLTSASIPIVGDTGNYEFLLIPDPSTHYLPTYATAAVSDGNENDVVFAIQTGVVVSGTLVDQNSAPIVNAPFVPYNGSANTSVYDDFLYPLTDSSGHFQLVVAAGNTRIVFFPPGIGIPSFTLSFTVSGDIDLGKVMVN